MGGASEQGGPDASPARPVQPAGSAAAAAGQAQAAAAQKAAQGAAGAGGKYVSQLQSELGKVSSGGWGLSGLWMLSLLELNSDTHLLSSCGRSWARCPQERVWAGSQ